MTFHCHLEAWRCACARYHCLCAVYLHTRYHCLCARYHCLCTSIGMQCRPRLGIGGIPSDARCHAPRVEEPGTRQRERFSAGYLCTQWVPLPLSKVLGQTRVSLYGCRCTSRMHNVSHRRKNRAAYMYMSGMYTYLHIDVDIACIFGRAHTALCQ